MLVSPRYWSLRATIAQHNGVVQVPHLECFKVFYVCVVVFLLHCVYLYGRDIAGSQRRLSLLYYEENIEPNDKKQL